MSINTINEKISEIINSLDELEHVESSELDSVRTKLEDVQEDLDHLSEIYGDDEYDIGDDDDDDDGDY